MNQVITRS